MCLSGDKRLDMTSLAGHQKWVVFSAKDTYLDSSSFQCCGGSPDHKWCC